MSICCHFHIRLNDVAPTAHDLVAQEINARALLVADTVQDYVALNSWQPPSAARHRRYEIEAVRERKF